MMRTIITAHRKDKAMDVNQVMQAIGTLGFPIVACCALFYYLNKEQESHKSEMQAVTDALNRNTDALLELKTIITMLTGRKVNNGSNNAAAGDVQRS